MQVDFIGYHYVHDSNFLTNHPLGSKYWLLLIIKTPAIFCLNGNDIHVKENSFILYTPNYPLRYGADNHIYIDDWLRFIPSENEIQLINDLKIPLNEPTYIGDVSGFSVVIKNMCYEFYSNHLNRLHTADLCLQLLLYKLNEQIQFQYPDTAFVENPFSDTFMHIRTDIYLMPEKEWDINSIAKSLSLSVSRFQHLYYKIFGVSFIYDIRSSRIKHSCQLLKKTNMTIDEIAFCCKYNSTSHFIKLFKEKIGMTPYKYRQQET